MNNSTPQTLQHSAQTESIRQGYLQAMGVQPWFPKRELIHAKAARGFEWLSVELPAAKPVHKPEKPARNPRQLLNSIVQQASAPVEAVEPEPPAKQTTTVVDKAALNYSQFRLIVQPINDDVLVVVQMPYTGLMQFSSYHQQLLSDILFTLKLPNTLQTAHREFVWPMTQFNTGLLAELGQDDGAAAEAVQAFLNNQFGFEKQQTVLLLGEAAARFVLEPTADFETLRGVRTAGKQRIAITHSLNELMKQPVLKQEAWDDLRPLLATA